MVESTIVSPSWRRHLLATAARVLPGGAVDSVGRLLGDRAAAACALARRIGPRALCRRTEFHGWRHLDETGRQGAILVTAPGGLGGFALWLVGLYHGRVDIEPPAPAFLLDEPVEGFGVHTAARRPEEVLRSGGCLGVLNHQDATEITDLARSCAVPILPILATSHKARYRLDIFPPADLTNRERSLFASRE